MKNLLTEVVSKPVSLIHLVSSFSLVVSAQLPAWSRAIGPLVSLETWRIGSGWVMAQVFAVASEASKIYFLLNLISCSAFPCSLCLSHTGLLESESVGRSIISDSFETPWTVAHQAPLSMEFSQARILEWVAISFSRGSSYFRDRTQVAGIADRFFTVSVTGKPYTGLLALLQTSTPDSSYCALSFLFPQ